MFPASSETADKSWTAGGYIFSQQGKTKLRLIHQGATEALHGWKTKNNCTFFGPIVFFDSKKCDKVLSIIK